MTSIARLKEQARLHEQKEEWGKAIQAYEQALRLAGGEAGEAEFHLFNRVGDLHLRLGRQQDAVRCYEEAADRYAEAGFYNNAIALCNKALRYAPDRAELFRKLGRYSGAQGFLTDARRYFLEYAERKQRAGRLQEAFGALEEFADLSDDPEMREMLAQRLEAFGEVVEAVGQLRRAYELRAAAGDAAAAEALKARVLTLDPGADLSAPPASAGRRRPTDVVPGLEPLPGIDIQTAADAAGIETPEAEPEDAVRPPAEANAAGVRRVDERPADERPGMLPTHRADAAVEDDIEGARDLPTLDPPDAEPEPLPLLGADDRDAVPPPAAVEPIALDMSLTPAPDGGRGTGAGGRERGAGRRADGGADGADGADAAVTAGLSRARAGVAAGRYAEAVRELGALRDRLSAGDGLDRALAILEDLATLEPDRMPAHQLRVEYAERRGNRSHLVEAYLGLAECLSRAGARAKAAAVFERVLDVDASCERARAGLAAARRGGEAAPDGDYVDLAALVASEVREAPAEASVETAVEAADDEGFGELLSQFKARATEPGEADDPAAHYDLGLAFKEMGLIDEAIAEFQKVLSGGEEQLKVYEELGQCFMLKEQYNVAGKIFGRALHVPRSDDRELLGVYYHLGRCFEELGQRTEARDAFERVVNLGGDFRDVSERLTRL